MPWFCEEIIAQSKPGLLDALRREPSLAKGLYAVDSDRDRLRQLPAEGLLFVRPIGPPEEVRDNLSWHDVPAGTAELKIAPDVPEVATISGTIKPSPPMPFLRYLKTCSETYKTAVAYYSAFSWGGPVEAEYAWVFLPSDLVYCGVEDGRTFRIYQPDGTAVEEQGSLLGRVLRHLGVKSPSGSFTPHTSNFPWSQYKVPGTG